ncbi:hypothetical protein SAMN05444972_108190 [Marininema halotolerans]|uniref:Uncharacterized protein n=1 Tax=Marininema halotolerans TaxID=1155944 RepID=A0A1I6T0W4_9BACL|nr:hypothetical protein SAMN05444972_108190 [Marininema halotolerans]
MNTSLEEIDGYLQDNQELITELKRHKTLGYRNMVRNLKYERSVLPFGHL